MDAHVPRTAIAAVDSVLPLSVFPLALLTRLLDSTPTNASVLSTRSVIVTSVLRTPVQVLVL